MSVQLAFNIFAAYSPLDFHLLPLLVRQTTPAPVPSGHAHISKGMNNHTEERRQGKQSVDGTCDDIAVDMLLQWCQ